MLPPPGDGVESVDPRNELSARLRRVDAALHQWAAWAPKQPPPPTLSRPSLLQLREQLTAEVARLDARGGRGRPRRGAGAGPPANTPPR
jgi:hypothetical protein